MRICRDYRRSVLPAPFLLMEGDSPLSVWLNVDCEAGEVFITTLHPGMEVPEGLKIFPWSPYLTVRGIDQAFQHPGVKRALAGALKGEKDSEDYLIEVLGSDSFWRPLDSVRPMRPLDYFKTHPFTRYKNESIRMAARRIVSEALLERIVLDPWITEMDLIEEATWN